jgi:PHS family inorganic phosphate transporter-like MFS transporter
LGQPVRFSLSGFTDPNGLQSGGSIVSIVVLAAFRTSIRDNGQIGHLNAVWRIIAGVILFPCAITLIQRLTMPESAKMKGVHAMRDDPTMLQKGTVSGLPHNLGEKFDPADDIKDPNFKRPIQHEKSGIMSALAFSGAATTASGKNQAWRDFRDYFSEWRHAKILIGTASTWFLVDIVGTPFYLSTSLMRKPRLSTAST